MKLGVILSKKNENSEIRHYEVKSLSEFRSLLDIAPNCSDNIYKQVCLLFKEIDFTTYGSISSSLFDERYNSIIRIYLSTRQILVFFKNTDITEKYLANFDTSESKLQTDNDEVNKLFKFWLKK